MLSLARELGKHIHEMECISSRELSEWMAFAKLENEDRDKRDLERKASGGAAARQKRALKRG